MAITGGRPANACAFVGPDGSIADSSGLFLMGRKHGAFERAVANRSIVSRVGSFAPVLRDGLNEPRGRAVFPSLQLVSVVVELVSGFVPADVGLPGGGVFFGGHVCGGEGVGLHLACILILQR